MTLAMVDEFGAIAKRMRELRAADPKGADEITELGEVDSTSLCREQAERHRGTASFGATATADRLERLHALDPGDLLGTVIALPERRTSPRLGIPSPDHSAGCRSAA
jgi:hypothetical protein